MKQKQERGLILDGWNLTGTSSGSFVDFANAMADSEAARQSAVGEDGDALSVSQAVEMAANALDAIPQLTVIGEVTGFRGPNARSGHCYFQIKDDASAVDCKIWRGVYSKRAFDLRDGLQVQFTGSFDLYKPTGRMSFIARSFSLAGEGLLRQQVAALAEKLRREGLMDEAHKRHVPVFCNRVAVVTSLSGAVIDDVKRTLRRRNPLVELICVGAKVQGEGAPAGLIEGLRRAAAIKPAPDCILLVRGGGSFEDLMTFNDESLARAVAACPVPVVTGIGHEPDTSICDMASDRRCSTPTAAAESVAPALADLIEVTATRERRLANAMAVHLNAARDVLGNDAQRAQRAMNARLERLRLMLDAAAARPCLTDPTVIVDRRRVELSQTAERLDAAIERSHKRFAQQLDLVAPRLCGATAGFSKKRHALELAASKLRHAGTALLNDPRSQLASSAAALDALSPLKVLARGYSIAYAPSGVLTSITDAHQDDEVRIALADGNVHARVTSVEAADNLSVDTATPAK